MKVIERLIQAIRAAGDYNPQAQTPPACILWPDHDEEWKAAIPLLRIEMPELLALGDYAPEARTGPAIWLRCAIAGKAEEAVLPKDRPPVLYLPGVSRQDLQATDHCPEERKPIAELAFRGAIWSQTNQRDWSVFAFLKSNQGGLALDVAQDKAAKAALKGALVRLLDQEAESLRSRKLDRDDLNAIATGEDPVRELLRWIDSPERFRNRRNESEWAAFIDICKSKFGFHPEKDGVLSGAERLAKHEGAWKAVWMRFCEAPSLCPKIPSQLRKCVPPARDIYWISGEGNHEGWPQWNEEQENALRSSLQTLQKQPPHETRKQIMALERQHGRRRDLVWAQLGEADLAEAIVHLACMAEHAAKSLATGSKAELANGYLDWGWRVDDALLRALAAVEHSEDVEAVTVAIRSMYQHWADEAARHLQAEVGKTGYVEREAVSRPSSAYKDGDCLLFVDGLRMDLAIRLRELLSPLCAVESNLRWAALPTVTTTGKPAISPIADKIQGDEVNADFDPRVAGTEQSAAGHFKKLLTDAGWILLPPGARGDGRGRAWCEYGAIDDEGHERGRKLAGDVERLLGEIKERILQLLAAGWKRIWVVTDHGWLLLPGGLPKTELAACLSENKWGRCASLKAGAISSENLFPWFWNPVQHFALAPGISCYIDGREYAHGGLTLQECLTLELVVSGKKPLGGARIAPTLHVDWRRLLCTVQVEGDSSGLLLDIRERAGDASSSLLSNAKKVREDGSAMMMVEDEDLEGSSAILVLLTDGGELVAQFPTTIGGDR